ncbi:unnamed protein product [Penicillium pancosmium]
MQDAKRHFYTFRRDRSEPVALAQATNTSLRKAQPRLLISRVAFPKCKTLFVVDLHTIMADPLSILGAALGVVSLGLQVREEITSYCKAWRGAEEEIQEIANKAESLEGPLKALREIIQETQLSNPGIAYDLQNKIQTIRGGILKVQNAVDRWKPALSAKGFGEKIRAQRKKAAYPFRKEALRALANELDSLQMGLQTTLHVNGN